MAGERKPIPLTSLGIEELGRVKTAIEEDLRGLMTGVRQLEMAVQKYNESKESLLALGPGSKDKEVMIPLTSSLYVPGMIDRPNRVMIDLGTQYYMDASIPEAANYLNRQIRVTQEQLNNMTQAAQQKSKQREAVVIVMQQKIAEMTKQAPAPPLQTH